MIIKNSNINCNKNVDIFTGILILFKGGYKQI